MTEEVKDEKIVEELKKALQERVNVLLAQDPTANRLQGALDYALGNIKLPDDDETQQGESTA
tara:strand:+ start:1480 stop:1665 length:186 start_codon:yes stop_codon:yes gene_type:complete